jgi:hypothetical protein
LSARRGVFLDPPLYEFDARDVARSARSKKAFTPTSDAWLYAVGVIKMVESFAKASSRKTIATVARLLEREGWAAHRSADRLENLSEKERPVVPPHHACSVILEKVASLYPEEEWEHEPWHVARAYLARLSDVGLEKQGGLRKQAAILLDAAETIDGLLRWYDTRRASLHTRDLTNDTIVAIMREWQTKPRETAKELKEHGHAVSEGAIKTALLRNNGLGRRRGNEQPLVFYVPALRRRDPQRE